MPSDVEGTRIWFLRHGEVEAARVGSFIGRTDCHLSDLGRHQAQAIAAYLEPANLDAIVSSPRRRALDTAAPLAQARNTKLDIRPAFAEMDFGAWDGLHWHEILERDEAAALAWQQDIMGTSAPQGETGTTFSERVAAGTDALLAEFKGRTIAVAGHAGSCRAILAHALGMPYVHAFAFAQDYGCLNAASWTGGYAQIALVNFVPGPRARNQGERTPDPEESG